MSNDQSELSSLDSGEGSKLCYACRHTKPLLSFNRSKRNKDGHQSQCKACSAEAIRTYRVANADAIREQKRVYRTANADAIREQKRAYCAANAEAIREQSRAYRAANADAIRAQRHAYRVAHPEIQRAYRAAHPEADCAYRAAHPEVQLVAQHRRHARIKNNGGSFTTQELRHMRLVQGGFCAYCQQHYARLTIDHIIPVKQGGRHEASNICLACSCCNLHKANRTPDQWLNRWYWDWRQREPEYIPPYWYD